MGTLWMSSKLNMHLWSISKWVFIVGGCTAHETFSLSMIQSVTLQITWTSPLRPQFSSNCSDLHMNPSFSGGTVDRISGGHFLCDRLKEMDTLIWYQDNKVRPRSLKSHRDKDERKLKHVFQYEYKQHTTTRALGSLHCTEYLKHTEVSNTLLTTEGVKFDFDTSSTCNNSSLCATSTSLTSHKPLCGYAVELDQRWSAKWRERDVFWVCRGPWQERAPVRGRWVACLLTPCDCTSGSAFYPGRWFLSCF